MFRPSFKKKNIKFKSYTIKAKEKIKTINSRLEYNNHNSINNFIELSKEEYNESMDFIKTNIDEIINPIKTTNLKKFPDSYIKNSNINWACYGLNHIFKINFL